MIKEKTKFKLADNSGGKIAECFHIYKASYGFPGVYILLSIKSIKTQSKIKKGLIYKGLIIRTRFKFQRRNGTSIKFGDNGVVLLTKKNELISNRIFGPIAIELRKKNLLKILSLSSTII